MAPRYKGQAAVKRPHWIVFVIVYFTIMHVIYGWGPTPSMGAYVGFQPLVGHWVTFADAHKQSFPRPALLSSCWIVSRQSAGGPKRLKVCNASESLLASDIFQHFATVSPHSPDHRSG